MGAVRYDLTGENRIERGTTRVIYVAWKDSAGSLIDLSSYTASMDFRDEEGKTTKLALTDSSGIDISTTFNSGADNIQITITATQSAAFPPKWRGLYQLHLTLSGVVTRLIYGSVETDEKIT